jgi:uncharacterized low-complexity protein
MTMTKAYIATAVAGALLLSVTAADAATRKHEASAAGRPAVTGPIVSDCLIVWSNDKAHCFGNSYRGYVSRTSRANRGGGGAY